MVVKGLGFGTVMVALLLASPARAQNTPLRERPPGPTQKQVVIFEDILRRAVQDGAVNMWNKVRRAAAAPDLLLSDAPVVNGYRIDEKLTFFSVMVPAIRPPLAFQMERLIRQNEAARQMQSQTQGRPPAVTVSNGVAPAPASAPPMSPFVDSELLGDPGALYTHYVQMALIDAMLENSSALQIPADGALVVAARDNGQPDPRMPADRADSQTLTFSIKGSDLVALQQRTITIEEARKRVTIRED